MLNIAFWCFLDVHDMTRDKNLIFYLKCIRDLFWMIMTNTLQTKEYLFPIPFIVLSVYNPYSI